MSELRYIATVSHHQQRHRYVSPAFATREEAIADAWQAKPGARHCSTSQAALYGGAWVDVHLHIRFHTKEF